MIVRVTNKMLATNYLNDMRTNLNNMKQLQTQMTTGKQIKVPSEDPFKASRAMQIYTDIDANKQYNQNIVDATNWLDTTDSSINQVGQVLNRVRELLVSSGNAGYGTGEKKSIKDEINEKVGQLSQILNTSFDGKYLFGGQKVEVKPVDVEKIGENNKLVFYKNGGGSLADDTMIPVDTGVTGAISNLNTNWASKTITFGVETSKDASGKPVYTNSSITLDNGTKLDGNVDKLIENIQSKIDSNTNLQNKVIVKKEIINGIVNIKFMSTPLNSVEITDNVGASGTNTNATTLPSEISSSFLNKIIMSTENDNLKKRMSIEVSAGVTLDYNVTSVDVLKYGSGPKDDLKDLLFRIVNHLDGNNDDGTAIDSGSAKKLTNEDLADMTTAINNILAKRSAVGAKQNSMDDAKARNTDQNFNLTEILSKTMDIDITEKTMEYSVMQTVYLASLQASAKVIQPTLMDYLR